MQSRFTSLVFAVSWDLHDCWCPSFSEVPAAIHKARFRSLEGRRVSSKNLSSVQDEALAVMNEKRTISSPMEESDYPAPSFRMCGEFKDVTVQFKDGAMSRCYTVLKLYCHHYKFTAHT